MAFETPTLSELTTRIETDVEARMTGADAKLPRSNLHVQARVQAGTAHGLYGFIRNEKKNIWPTTAEGDLLDDNHGATWGVRRLDAAFASGNVTFTGTDGTVIPVGRLARRADGVEFVTSSEATIAAGSAAVVMTAVWAGADGNASAGAAVTLISPIAGVTSAGAVAAGGLTGGADRETDAAYRQRILDRIQQPPHGGADFDYLKWAKDHSAAITDVWVFPNELGLGTVTVRFMMRDTYDDGIPLAADVEALQVALDALRPVTVDLTVAAPTAVVKDVEIAGLNPATDAVKAAIVASLADLVRREAVTGGTIPLSHWREAVSTAAGEYDHELISPAADVTVTNSQITTLGDVTWS